MPLGKFIFLHLVVVVSIDFSISFLVSTALIPVRDALPHVRVFFSGSWSSVEFLFLFHDSVVCRSSLLRSGVSCFIEGLSPMGLDFDEEGIGPCCDPFLEDLYDFSD